MPIKITKKTFSGTSKVFDGTLALVLMDVLKSQAISNIKSVAKLTNSTAVVGVDTLATDSELLLSLGAHVTPDANGVAKSVAEAAFTNHTAALREVHDQYNKLAPLLGLPLISGNVSATASNGTVEALTKTLAGASANYVSHTGFVDAVRAINQVAHETAKILSVAAGAVGVAGLNSGSYPDADYVFSAITTGTGATVTAADAATATVDNAQGTTTLAALAANIAGLVEKLDDIQSVTFVPSVVAG